MTDILTVKTYTPDESDFEKIRAFTRREFSEDELYVFEATLCDNDIDRDFEKFSDSALSALQKLFIGKTGIKDHSMKAQDQTARIFDTRLEKQRAEQRQTASRILRSKQRRIWFAPLKTNRL